MLASHAIDQYSISNAATVVVQRAQHACLCAVYLGWYVLRVLFKFISITISKCCVLIVISYQNKFQNIN